MKKIIVLLLVAAAAAYLLLWPVPVDPVAWDAPEAPELTGPYAANDELADVERLAAGQGHGPEDVAIDGQGNLYVGYEDGRLVRYDPDGNNGDLITNTEGRPLGLDLAPDAGFTRSRPR